jgi:MFS family permease
MLPLRSEHAAAQQADAHGPHPGTHSEIPETVMATSPVLQDRRVRVTSWTFAAVAAFLVLQAVGEAIPRHAFDLSWPKHARFHLTVGAGNQVGFALVALLVARLPFRRGERWSWYALLLFAVFEVLVLVPAAVWHASGPQPWAWVLIGGFLVTLFGGLAATWPLFFRSREPERAERPPH